MRKIVLILLFLSHLNYGQQTILENTNLPIVVIQTDIDPNSGNPYEIVDEPKVPANMKIIYRTDGSRNYLTDISNPAHLNYNGKIMIEFRGSSSQALDKKAYGLSTKLADNVTNNNVSLLGMPAENDWVLNGLAFDPSMVRDYLSYNLSRNLGNYAPRGKYVEVIVNGDYKGVYILFEKIKVDSERVNLVKISTSDNSQPNVTGGYIVKADKTTGGDVVAWTVSEHSFIHDTPKTEVITPQQNSYIENVFLSLANTTNPMNSSLTNGYPSMIDIPSFLDFMLIAELASNPDVYTYSTYFHKDRNGKLRAGPIWDYNLSFGNDLFLWGYDRSKTDVWQFNDGGNIGPQFWRDLFNDPTFKCYLAKRWYELTAPGKPLNLTTISNLIDSYVALLSESQVRENTRWPLTVNTQAENVLAMKTWTQERITWINNNIGSSAACSNVTVPNLVISKIHYNPLTVGSNSSNDLEFIEITNNSNQNVDVTGFYIRELGISYQFPAGAIINANQKIYLCSKTATFSSYYGITPFGQFTRNLSNKSYKIVLCDAYGNLVDEVQYQDTAPWPTSTDGTGPYLKLVDINSDNSLAENWIAFQELLSKDDSTYIDQTTFVYPNPGIENISISNLTTIIDKIKIYDLQGRMVFTKENCNGNTINVDISNLARGFYNLQIQFENNSQLVNKKISKK